MRRGRPLTFWLAVGGVSLIAPVVFNIAADRFEEHVPGLGALRDYITRRNG